MTDNRIDPATKASYFHLTKQLPRLQAPMSDKRQPPHGQRYITHFERFGLPTFAFYKPDESKPWQLTVKGTTAPNLDIKPQLAALPRQHQTADFHCVTSWSYADVSWGGVAFADVYNQLIKPHLPEGNRPNIVVFRGDDSYVTSLPLEDALAGGVMIADEMNGEPIHFDHGAPLRLVAPKHYGYKNVKHLRTIELADSDGAYTFPKPWPRLMEHPRGRVEYQERGRHLPPWLFRWLYLPIVWPTRLLFRQVAKHRRSD